MSEIGGDEREVASRNFDFAEGVGSLYEALSDAA